MLTIEYKYWTSYFFFFLSLFKEIRNKKKTKKQAKNIMARLRELAESREPVELELGLGLGMVNGGDQLCGTLCLSSVHAW